MIHVFMRENVQREGADGLNLKLLAWIPRARLRDCRCSILTINQRRDPRWQQSRWKLHLPPPRTKLELQQMHRTINLNNQLKTSCTEVNDYRFTEEATSRLVGSMERKKNWPHSHQRNISAAEFPPEKYRVSTPCQTPQPRAPEPRRGAHKTSGCEN